MPLCSSVLGPGPVLHTSVPPAASIKEPGAQKGRYPVYRADLGRRRTIRSNSLQVVLELWVYDRVVRPECYCSITLFVVWWDDRKIYPQRPCSSIHLLDFALS